jgi:type VI protein secretion system component VasF
MAGGYRDEREAAMAANEVLQRENAELKQKLEALEASAREGGLTVAATEEPKESSATTWAIVAVAVLLCTAFVGFFYVMRPTG